MCVCPLSTSCFILQIEHISIGNHYNHELITLSLGPPSFSILSVCNIKMLRGPGDEAIKLTLSTCSFFHSLAKPCMAMNAILKL